MALFSRRHGVPAGDTSTETKIARVATGSAAPRSRAWPGPPILIPRGGPRPWGSYQRSTVERCPNRPFRWSCDSVSPTRMGWISRSRSAFCACPPYSVLARPMGMFICQWCVAQASQLAVEDPAEGSMRLEVSGLEVRCSFCGKEAWQGCSWSPAGWRGAWWQFWPGRSDLRRVPGPVRGNPGRHLILTAPGGVSWRGPIQGVDDVPCRDLQLAPQLFEHSGGFVSGRVVGRCLGLAAPVDFERTAP
jgi:hypothetical protein